MNKSQTGYVGLAIAMVSISKSDAYTIFTFIFILSDSFTLLASMACHVSLEASVSLKKIAYAVSLHWIGVGWAVGIQLVKR